MSIVRNWLNNSIEQLIFLIAFLFFLCVSYHLVFNLKFLYGDALSRTFHAYAVFFGNEPKLAAIGLVWPPVPTIIQLPLVLIPSLNVFGFAGNVTSALFMAGTVVMVHKTLLLLKLKRYEAIAFTSLLLLNPMIIFYGVNGMSEAVALLFLVGSIFFSIKYVLSTNIASIIWAGVFVALAIMSRWEMILLVPILMMVTVIHVLKNYRVQKIQKAESAILIFLIPILFAVFLWLFLNWAIVHDPLHFIKSVYANRSQSANLINDNKFFAEIHGSVSKATRFVLYRALYIFPLFIIMLPLVLSRCLKVKNISQIFLLVGTSFFLILFHIGLLYKGQSFGWLRFFISLIPLTILLVGLYLGTIKSKKIRVTIFILLMVLVIMSSLSTLFAMQDSAVGREENLITKAVISNDERYISTATYEDDLNIARYVINNTSGKILIDDFTGFPIIYFTRSTDRFIDTVDTNFNDALVHPRNYKDLNFFLVHSKGGVGDLDAINREYPTMYEHGAGFASLVADFGVWRLYKIYKDS